MIQNTINEKVCNKCFEKKALDCFADNRKTCRKCRQKYLTKHRKQHGHKYKDGSRFKQHKRECIRRNLENNLTKEQFAEISKKDCAYCGEKYKNTVGSRLDRINSKKGYTLENVVSCCYRCNTIKMALSQEELYQHIIKMLPNLKKMVQHGY